MRIVRKWSCRMTMRTKAEVMMVERSAEILQLSDVAVTTLDEIGMQYGRLEL